MKKFIFIFLFLLVLVMAGIGIFLATFNVDKYRPVVAQKIEEALGKKVELGKLSLGFNKGLAFRIQGIAVYGKSSHQALAKVGEVAAVIRLMPLLQKNIQVASIFIVKPYVEIERGADGFMRVGGVAVGPTRASNQGIPAKETSPAAQQFLAFSVDSIRVQKAKVVYKDLSPSNPMDFSIDNIDVEIKNFSLNKSFLFEVLASVFSADQNVEVSGELLLPGSGQSGFLKNFDLDTNLGRWNFASAAQAFPALGNLKFRENPQGGLNIRLEEVDLGALADLKAHVKLNNAKISLAGIPSAFETVFLNMDTQGGNLKVRDSSASFAGGQINLDAAVNGFQSSNARSQVKLAVKNVSLSDAIPASSPNAPRLGGNLSLDFEGNGSGLGWPEISRSLNGKGRVILKDGVIFNFNLAKQVFEKLSVIPGIASKLESELPPNYKEKLFAPHTLMHPLDFSFEAQNGQIPFQNLRVATDYVSIVGNGHAGLGGAVEAAASLQMAPEISAAILKSVSEISVLANTQGQIEIPILVTGQAPSIQVFPDLNIIATRFAAGKAQQLLGDFFNKGQGEQQPASSSGTKEEKLLKNFLGALQS